MNNNKSEPRCSDCYYVEYCENNIKKVTSLKYKSIEEFEKFLGDNNLIGKVNNYKLLKGGN